MDSYVVRIYRRPKRKSRILIGTVEAAGTEMRIAFSNIEELWEILRHRRWQGGRKNRMQVKEWRALEDSNLWPLDS